MVRILLIEDDSTITAGLAYSLEQEGWSVTCKGTLAQGRNALETGEWARLAVEKAPSCTCLEGWTSPQPDMYGYRAPIFTNWTRTHWPFFDGAR